jgi:glutathione synthase/RimK-type ligase-like ATP-grasp enzyme
MLSNPVEWKDDPCGRSGFRAKALNARKAGIDLLEIGLSNGNLESISSKKSVHCTRFEGGQFLQSEIPFQSIGAIYDFYLYGEKSCGKLNDSIYLSIASLLEKSGKPFVNYPGMISLCSDKWQCCQSLAGQGVPMPETSQYSPYSLQSFLDRFGFVFLKPRKGYEGRGQIVVRRQGNSLSAVEGGSKTEFNSIVGLMRFLGSKGLGADWITQEGKVLIQIDGRIADFRAIFQRDSEGVLCETAIYARVGAKGSYQSNIGTAQGAGGTARDPADIVGGWKELHGRISGLCISVVGAIERVTLRPVGEIGIDIAQSISGDLYFIEANTKLGHLGLLHLSELKKGPWEGRLENYLMRPIRYAKGLIGFS